jgi:hypothetical protein
VFYDVNYLKDTPAPLLEWTASDWPSEATKATIKYWCKLEENKTQVDRITLREALDSKTATTATVSGVKLRAELNDDDGQLCVLITEEHGPQSPNIDDIRVSLGSGLRGKANRIVHQFDAAKDAVVVTHKFFFPANLRDSIASGTIEVAEGRAVKANALQLPDDQPVEVEVSGSLPHFPSEATAGSR